MIASRAALAVLLVIGGGACAPQPSQTQILWDTWGVPHVYAPTTDSLFFAFGWSQMESHGDLILRLTVMMKHLDVDMPGIAHRWYGEQEPTGQIIVDAFAAGMNAYAAAHPERLDDEVEIVLPIEPTDVLAHIIRAIHFTFVAGPGAVGAAHQSLESEPVAAGSNAWAIAPSRTAGGDAMLLANPHLPWQDLFLFYESHLIGPGVNVYGTALVGFPIPAIAFNDYLGWTHTVNTHDGADAYRLTLADGGYRFDGQIRPFDVDTQAIHIKDGDDSQLIIRRSVHGPVIAENEGGAVALRVVGLDQANIVDQYWDMMRARNLSEFESALARLQMPMFTTMYADRDGHIMHLFGGRVPVRPRGDWGFWSGMVRGDSSSTLWTATHEYSDLPKAIDPMSGWLQNANDPPWTTTFPAALRPDDFPPYMAPRSMALRPQRSARMLIEDAEITFDDLIEYKLSTRMELADRLVDDLVAAARAYGPAQAREAADVLEAWDRKADAESRGAVLFTRWAMEVDLRHVFRVPWSEQQPRTTPGGLLSPRTAAAALARAAERVQTQFDELDVRWGDAYRLRSGDIDLPANGGPGALGIFRVLGFSEDVDGRYRANFGDSYVALIEFSDPVRARVLTSYGNATQRHSRHIGDQLALFSRKELRTPWRTRADIEANLETRTFFGSSH